MPRHLRHCAALRCTALRPMLTDVRRRGAQVKKAHVPKRVNAIINRLSKTKLEKKVDFRGLARLITLRAHTCTHAHTHARA